MIQGLSELHAAFGSVQQVLWQSLVALSSRNLSNLTFQTFTFLVFMT